MSSMSLLLLKPFYFLALLKLFTNQGDFISPFLTKVSSVVCIFPGITAPLSVETKSNNLSLLSFLSCLAVPACLAPLCAFARSSGNSSVGQQSQQRRNKWSGNRGSGIVCFSAAPVISQMIFLKSFILWNTDGAFCLANGFQINLKSNIKCHFFCIGWKLTTFLIFSVKATYHTNPKIALLPFDFWFDTIEFIHMYICIFDLSWFDPILSYVHFLVLNQNFW